MKVYLALQLCCLQTTSCIFAVWYNICPMMEGIDLPTQAIICITASYVHVITTNLHSLVTLSPVKKI